MNRVTPLVECPLVAITRFDHLVGQIHRDPRVEVASDYSVSFVECGSFELRISRRLWRLFPGTVFVTRPGLEYRCRHFSPTPSDVCLSVSYSGAFAEDVYRTINASTSRSQSVVQPTNRLAYLGLRLAQLGGNRGDRLTIETLAGELLAAAATSGGEDSGRLYKRKQLAWYAERLRCATFLIESRYAEPLSLSSLARVAGMSPFHFARTFRELIGMPPHRCLLNTRLERSARRLREGGSVTDSCFAVGFNNLSHFIRMFRRKFGVSPSQYAC